MTGVLHTMKTIIQTTALVLIFVSTAMATKFAPPQDRVVKSLNGQYRLDINAKTGGHEIREGEKLLWSFKRDVRHHDYYLSNDGKFVLWVSWKFVKADDVKKEALAIYSSEGLIWKRSFAEASEPRRYQKREVGPIGDFWRIWRGEITRKGEVISIAVEGKKENFKVDLSKVEELARLKS